MDTTTDTVLDALLVNPRGHGDLRREGDGYVDLGSGERFRVVAGIPVMVGPAEVTGLNRKYQRRYDRLAREYDLAERVATRFGDSLRQVRREIAAALAVPAGARVLEVSVGTGLNLPYLRTDATYVGLDLSLGMLRQCRRNARAWRRPISLVQATAEALPFRDGAFDAVLHFGGINFFNDKQTAVREMIRVARPGAHIVIGDETERRVQNAPVSGRFYEETGHGLYAPPVDAIPAEMSDVMLRTLWRDRLYLVSFRTP
jgi:ubiquinone/menaquinone biosynthesis C-methylase UbiE